MTETTELDRIRVLFDLTKKDPHLYNENLNAYIIPALLELAYRVKELETKNGVKANGNM